MLLIEMQKLFVDHGVKFSDLQAVFSEAAQLDCVKEAVVLRCRNKRGVQEYLSIVVYDEKDQSEARGAILANVDKSGFIYDLGDAYIYEDSGLFSKMTMTE